MTKRGKIILIEGTDSSGKMTQSIALSDRLLEEGVSCARMDFPRYHTPTGKIISQCYLGREGGTSWFGDADKVDSKVASLYYAIDRFAAREEIEAIVSSGSHLILDRYVESNKGHQAGKETDPVKREETIKFIDDLEYGLLQLPKPDATIFLYIPYQVGMELKERSGIERDGHELTPEHLKRAEITYLELAKINKWIKINCCPDGTISSLRSPKNLAREVYSHAVKIISS